MKSILLVLAIALSLFAESPLFYGLMNFHGDDLEKSINKGYLGNQPVFSDPLMSFETGNNNTEYYEMKRIKEFSEYIHGGKRSFFSIFAGPMFDQEMIYKTTPEINNSLSAGFLMQKKCFSAVLDYRLQHASDTIPVFRRNNLSMDAERAIFQIDTSLGIIQLGRDRQSWGNSRTGNLSISKEAHPMDKLRYQVRFGDFYFDTFHAKLVSDTTLTIEDRYLAGHKIVYRPNSKLEISASELIIYGGENRNIEFYYFIPILCYSSVQRNEAENSDYNDNNFLSLDISYLFLNSMRLYGTLFIDDLQIDKKEKGDFEPNEIGYTLGIDLFNLLSIDNLDLGIEYVRVNNWTYNQNFRRNVYINQNLPIGSPFGNDFWYVDGLIRYSINYKISIEGKYKYMSHGEGRIDAEWTQPWFHVDDYSESFPTGTVEKTSKPSLKVILYPSRFMQVFTEGGVYLIRNRDNKDDYNSTLPFIRIGLQSQFILGKFDL
ncbi:MAG: hypothetical protein JXA60_02415 [Candidatus Coatesbacteria bacterium]|nr:hypothetical protein [Candidatus Coatesbacteria bacterium]